MMKSLLQKIIRIDLEIDESADGDEFIFYNGKMMKRSYLLKLKKEAEERKNAK